MNLTLGANRYKAMQELRKAINASTASTDQRLKNEAYCDLSRLYEVFGMYEEVLECVDNIQCEPSDEAICRKISTLLLLKSPKQALSCISEVFRTSKSAHLLDRCFALKIECHILMKENELALKSMKILEAKQSPFLCNMIKGLVLMRNSKQLEAQKCLLQADSDFKIAAEENMLTCCIRKGTDDNIFTNLIFLVLNSNTLQTDYNSFISRITESILNSGVTSTKSSSIERVRVLKNGFERVSSEYLTFAFE